MPSARETRRRNHSLLRAGLDDRDRLWIPQVAPNRPDVESWVQAAVGLADREVSRQRAASRPRLDLVASYDNVDSGGAAIGAGGKEILLKNLSLRLGIPILDGGRAAALTQAAALRHDVAIQELEKTRRRVERETRAAFQGVMGEGPAGLGGGDQRPRGSLRTAPVAGV